MKRLTWITMLVVIALLLGGCFLLGKPTPTPAPTGTPYVPPTSTSTRIKPTATQTATPVPTSTFTPTPTSTPEGVGWSRYPATLDFRDALPDGSYLWLASSGGLVRYNLITDEWNIWTEADGLVDNELESLAEQGDWLWIGTQGGISRYNRRTGQWNTYTTKNGLSSNHDVKVYYDGKTVWAGTINGLSWYDPMVDEWESLFTTGDIDLAGVECLLSDDQYVWVSVGPDESGGGGIIQWDRTSGIWTAVSQQPGSPPANSYVLTQNEEFLWAAPEDGLPWEYNKQSGQWRQVTEIEPAGVPQGARYTGAHFFSGALWFFAHHSGELVRYDAVSHQTSRYPAPRLASLDLEGQIKGQNGMLWFFGRNGLLVLYLDTGEWNSLRPGLGAVFGVLGYRGGDLLLDTDLGPGFWSPDSGEWRPLSPVGGFGKVNPNGVAVDKEGQNVWVAQLIRKPDDEEPPQLLYYSKPGVEPQQYAMIPPAGWELLELLSRPTGNTLWFVGSHGFLSYNPAINQWGVFELGEIAFSDIRFVRQQGQVVWFATTTSLGNFDTTTGTYTVAPLTIPEFTRMDLAVGEGIIWILADGSLYQGSMDGDEWTVVSISAPCLDQATQIEYWEGAWWVGGANGAGRVELYGGVWECFTPANGMMDKEFEQMFPTNDALWFSKPGSGLWRYKSH